MRRPVQTQREGLHAAEGLRGQGVGGPTGAGWTRLLLLTVWIGGLGAGCANSGGEAAAPGDIQASDAPRFATEVELPQRDLGFRTGKFDRDGHPVIVGCVTCHRLIGANKDNTLAEQLSRFHVGAKVTHGNLTCRSCHNPPRYDEFKLVTGRTVPYAEVMELCGQCHSRQRADYEHGAHGGMAGYWDLTRGPRQRNHCIHCHRPHDPRFRQVRPAPRPRYRGLEESTVHQEQWHGEGKLHAHGQAPAHGPKGGSHE